MKISIGLLLGILCFSHFAIAQKVFVEKQGLDVLYIDGSGENDIKITVKGVHPKKVVIKTSENMEYHKTERREYIKVLGLGIGVLEIGKLKGKDTVWLDKRMYHLRRIVLPSAYIIGNENLKKSTIKRALTSQNEIYVSVPHYSWCAGRRCEVLNVDVFVKGMNHQHFKMRDEKFTDEMKMAFKALTDGDYVRFFNIQVIDPRVGDTLMLKTIEMIIGDGSEIKDIANFPILYIEVDENNVYKNGFSPCPYTIRDVEEIIQVDSSIIDGKITYYTFQHYFERREVYFKDGTIVKEENFDDKGFVIFRLKKLDEITWEYTSYYLEKNTIHQKMILYESVHFEIEKSRMDSLNEMISPSEGQTIRLDDEIEYYISSVFLKFHKAPCEKYISYWPNGKIQCEGQFDLKLQQDMTQLSKWMYSSYKPFMDVSFYDGIWKYYNSEGQLILEKKFDLGNLVSEINR